MAILLIGSTGNGKSTLGNYLVDPREETRFDNQVFKTAQNNLPQTQDVSQCAFEETFKGSSKVFTVIDTPGLNENNVKDLQHMIQIVENLQKVNGILACVFVVKFNTKIDAQYHATVQYYRKLLPSLFERNVIIVLTDYATDVRSEKLRKKQGIDVSEIKSITLREIVKSGSLAYEPLIFTIDCLPIDDEEEKFNQAERKAILSKIAAQKAFSSKEVKIAKTPYLKSLDQEQIKECEGEITGYNKRLQQANGRAKEALEKIQLKQQEITDKEKTLKSLSDEVTDKDSSELTEVASWSISESWKWFQYFSRTFDKTAPCEIESVSKWTNGNCEWKDYEETKFSVKGKVEGKFMRGIYANLAIEACKRKKYATEIALLRQQICKVKEHLESLLQHLSEIRDRYKEYTEDIKLLEQFIDERRKMIKNLDSDYLALDEARERLKHLESR